jgi:hypothetical protein
MASDTVTVNVTVNRVWLLHNLASLYQARDGKSRADALWEACKILAMRTEPDNPMVNRTLLHIAVQSGPIVDRATRALLHIAVQGEQPGAPLEARNMAARARDALREIGRMIATADDPKGHEEANPCRG